MGDRSLAALREFLERHDRERRRTSMVLIALLASAFLVYFVMSGQFGYDDVNLIKMAGRFLYGVMKAVIYAMVALAAISNITVWIVTVHLLGFRSLSCCRTMWRLAQHSRKLTQIPWAIWVTVVGGGLLLARFLADIPALALVAMLPLAISLTSLLINIRPPSILVLGSSSEVTFDLLAKLKHESNLPFHRIVSLLDPAQAGFDATRYIPIDSFLRTDTGEGWESAFHSLARESPLIVVDTRAVSAPLKTEIRWLHAENLFPQVVFVVEEDGEVPLLHASLCDRVLDIFTLRLRTPHELASSLAEELRISNQARLSHGNT